MATILDASDVARLLRGSMPDECELAGRSFVTAVSVAVANGDDANTQLGRPDDAAHVNPEAALLAVAAAANLIKTLMEIYISLEKRGEGQPTPDQFNAEVAKAGVGITESAINLAAAVYKAIIGK